MLEYSTDCLKKAVSIIRARMQSRDQKMKKLDKKIAELKRQKEQVAGECKFSEWHIERIKEILILNEGLPPHIAAVQEKIRALVQKSQREDITVKTLNELEQEIARLKQDLQKKCPHPFILGHKSYRPSDPDNWGYPGKRFCIICGVSEFEYRYGSQYRGTGYSILKTTPKRVVRDNYGFHEFKNGFDDFSKGPEEIMQKYFFDDRVNEWCKQAGV